MSREKKPRRDRTIKTNYQLKKAEDAIKELESQLNMKDFLRTSDIMMLRDEIKAIRKEIIKYYMESQKCHL